MAKSLRQQVDDLQAENDELQSIVDDYEAKFDLIADALPEDDGDDDDEDDDRP